MDIRPGDIFENQTRKHRGLNIVVIRVTPNQVHYRFRNGPGRHGDHVEGMRIAKFLNCYRQVSRVRCQTRQNLGAGREPIVGRTNA